MKRAYESALRAEQTEQTRERILAALAAELSRGREDFSIRDVAARAGVSVRTVHHHFPTRESRVDAVSRYLERQTLADERGPEGAGDLVPYAARVARAALAHEPTIRALVSPGIAARVRKRRRAARLGRIEAAVAERGLPEAEARRLAALIKAITSADFVLALIDSYGVARDDAAEAVALAVRGVLEASGARERPRPSRSRARRP